MLSFYPCFLCLQILFIYLISNFYSAYADRRVKRERLDAFILTLLRQGSVVTEFDETLWFAIADKVTVYVSYDIQFTFRYGTVIEA